MEVAKMIGLTRQRSMSLRRVFVRAFLLTLALFFPLFLLAADYPSRAIKVIIGFSSGGSTDAIGRFYAQKLSEELHVPVVVENKPGAAQLLAIKTLIGAPPDGYTLYVGTASAFSQGPGVMKDLPYSPMRDFSFISLMAKAPGVIFVSSDLPIHNIKELIDYANANSGRLNYGSSGVGSASHLLTEYLLQLTKLKMAHIPYKSDADIVREMMTGSVHLGISPAQGVMSYIASGRIRAIAVTGPKRLKSLPNVASLMESDIAGIEGLDPYTIYGLAGPPGMPSNIIEKLNTTVRRISSQPEVAAHVRERMYLEPGLGNAEQFRQYVQDDLSKWSLLSKSIVLSD